MRAGVSVLVLLASGFIALAVQPALASGAFEEGMRHYNAGRFQHALLYLSQAAGLHPTSPMIHYYLANALVRLNMHDQAREEYALSYRLDPYGTVSGYCRQALAAYGTPISEADVAVSAGGAAAATASAAQADLGATGPLPARNSAGCEVDRVKSVIRRQAAYEKCKHQSIAESLAKHALRQGDQDAKRIQEEAAREIDAVLTPPATFQPFGRLGMMSPLFDLERAKARADEIRRNAKEAEARARMLAQNRASEYKQWSREREDVLDEVVHNLERQLEELPRPGSVKLQAVGTDLYVRYYGHSRSLSRPPAVRPAVVRIVGERAQQGALDAGLGEKSVELRRTRSVRGKVLH